MMKKRIVALCMGTTLFAGNVVYAQKLDLENQFTRPLSDVMNDLSRRFDVKFKYNVDTIGKRLPYADFRIRPYSLEESLTNVLSFFDFKYQNRMRRVIKLSRMNIRAVQLSTGKKCWLISVGCTPTGMNGRNVVLYCVKKCVSDWS